MILTWLSQPELRYPEWIENCWSIKCRFEIGWKGREDERWSKKRNLEGSKGFWNLMEVLGVVRMRSSAVAVAVLVIWRTKLSSTSRPRGETRTVNWSLGRAEQKQERGKSESVTRNEEREIAEKIWRESEDKMKERETLQKQVFLYCDVTTSLSYFHGGLLV